MTILGRLARTGWRRGLRDGSTGWLTVGVGITALRLLGRVLSEREIRATVELHTGEAVEIRAVEPPAR